MRLLTSCFLAFICCALLAWQPRATALGTPNGTEFTFQGRLTSGGSAIDGDVDLKFRLFDDAVAGTQIGGELEALNVTTVDGTFAIDLDFGSGVFESGKRWLEIDVRNSGDVTYETLAPRQPIMPAPLAQVAEIALNAPSVPFMYTGSNATFTEGNVGIGTTTPQSKLEVRGDSAWPLRVSGTTNAGIRIESDSTASSWAIYHESSSDNLNFRDSTTGATRMSITGSNGNVGIGTTNPLSNLHIAPASGSASFAMIGAGEPVGLSFAVGNNGLAIGKRDADGSNFEYLGRWTFDGKLGVSTDTPDSLLTVSPGGVDGARMLGFAEGTTSSFFIESGFAGSNTNNYLSMSTDIGGVSPIMTWRGNRYVGIGTTSPTSKLHIFDSGLNASLRITGDDPVISLENTGSGGRNYSIYAVDGNLQLRDAVAGTPRLLINPSGNIGIGTSSPQAGLSVTKVNPQIDPTVMGVHVGMIPFANNSAASVTIAGGSEGAQLRFFEIGGENANARLWYQPSTNDLRFDGAGLSKVSVPVLEIRGGADIVEGFDTSNDEALEPGTVVVIDPNTPGALMESADAYDFKVAGVVSGANGVAPGIHLGQESVMDGETKVAMTGRVYVKCSAENGAIKPGTLLTTASLAGHAMAATDAARSNGAVIGKAMSSLDEGTGLVLVLVNLQ